MTRLDICLEIVQKQAAAAKGGYKVVFLEIEKILLQMKLDFLSQKSPGSKNYPKKLCTSVGFVKKTDTDQKKESIRSRLLRFITERGKMPSLEVYGSFLGINKREIRRVVGELVKEGKITRSVSGNTAIYSIVKNR